jgi:formiminoglutamase
MADSLHIADFLDPVEEVRYSSVGYLPSQIGHQIDRYSEEFPEVKNCDIAIVFCPEYRGDGPPANEDGHIIRSELYALYQWHTDMRLADLGNIKSGSSLSDTVAALKTVIKEVTAAGKTILIVGGSHDLTLAQYYAFVDNKKVIDVSCIDSLLDLELNAEEKSRHFLMEILTGEPNYVRHYNHIGFQSYMVHPNLVETLDKLRFDCYRVGHVRENIEEMEPVIRQSDLISFDISSIANGYAPCNRLSPNGLTGEEACALLRFAGMNSSAHSIGIYGYRSETDMHNLTAKQVAHMIWYFIDGRSRGKKEPSFIDRDAFNEYHTAFAEVSTTFLQSKKTGRWWMQMPDSQFIACSYKDYVVASSNEIPERWLRAQERS